MAIDFNKQIYYSVLISFQINKTKQKQEDPKLIFPTKSEITCGEENSNLFETIILKKSRKTTNQIKTLSEK